MVDSLKNIKFLDTTLRDGEQSPGVSLTVDEKLWVARKLDSLGVDVIEAGSAITSKGERESMKAVANEGLNAEIASYCRIKTIDVDKALECDVDAIHLVVPVSDLHIERKLKKDRETVLREAVSVCEYAKDHGLIVELSGEDASRADLDYLTSVYKAGVDAGADRLCFCDTVGILTPEKAGDVFSKISNLGAPMSVHCHNDFGMATANTIAALRSGASCAHVTINGIGERAGNTPIEEVVMVLESLYGAETNIDCKQIYSISRLVSRLTGMAVAPNKAIVGTNAFTHEAGIHVHGLMADTNTYESIKPELVGRERKIVLGKHAGSASVELALRELGLVINDEQLQEIVARIKDVADRGKRITDADLQSIAETVLEISSHPRVELKELTVVSGTVTPTASIKLSMDGNEVVESGIGTGPVDAAIVAIRKAIAEMADIRLEEYHVDAITGGTDALVEVIVKLSRDGKMATARGARSDIIMASVEAVVAGINQLMKEND